MVQIVRVYSGDDGESHFEHLTPDQLAEIVFPLGAGEITLGRRPSPTFSDFHTAPRRQYVVNLAGIAEFETADGTKVRMVPGDVLVAEDLTTGTSPEASAMSPAFPWLYRSPINRTR